MCCSFRQEGQPDAFYFFEILRRSRIWDFLTILTSLSTHIFMRSVPWAKNKHTVLFFSTRRTTRCILFFEILIFRRDLTRQSWEISGNLDSVKVRHEGGRASPRGRTPHSYHVLNGGIQCSVPECSKSVYVSVIRCKYGIHWMVIYVATKDTINKVIRPST